MKTFFILSMSFLVSMLSVSAQSLRGKWYTDIEVDNRTKGKMIIDLYSQGQAKINFEIKITGKEGENSFNLQAPGLFFVENNKAMSIIFDRNKAKIVGVDIKYSDEYIKQNRISPAKIQVIKDQMAKKLNSREALAELSRFMPFSIVSQIVYRDHEKLVLSIFKSQNKFDRFVFYHMK